MSAVDPYVPSEEEIKDPVLYANNVRKVGDHLTNQLSIDSLISVLKLIYCVVVLCFFIQLRRARKQISVINSTALKINDVRYDS